jgi:hypothetical protein
MDYNVCDVISKTSTFNEQLVLDVMYVFQPKEIIPTRIF